MNQSKINVTKPFLPPLSEYQTLISEVFKRGWLTNHGPLVLKLEHDLKHYLNTPYIQYVTNGTVALQLAIKCLELEGEVITTPFSYVATTSGLVWENCKPIFADIDPNTFNIDPKRIEECITPRTSAILATHVFGNPCDVEAIDEIAKKHNLKVIYDAAHAFSVTYKDKSILEYGHMSTLSFHATKIFHTVEGGAVISSNQVLHDMTAYLKNFGHNGYEDFHGLGINGKNSEIHAAMGLCNMKYIEKIRQKYQRLYSLYLEELRENDKLSFQRIMPDSQYNFAYFPVVFQSEDLMLRVKARLENVGVYTRRYFYPSLSKLPYVGLQITPLAEDISSRILCLPLYFELPEKEVKAITSLIINALVNES